MALSPLSYSIVISNPAASRPRHETGRQHNNKSLVLHNFLSLPIRLL